MLKSKGHEVLRLPQYHCQLNPIELIWADLKRFIENNNNNNQHSINFIETLIHNSIKNINSDKWKACIEHTSKIEEDYWKSDGIVDNMTEELIIDFNSDSETESDSTDSYYEPEGDHTYCLNV